MPKIISTILTGLSPQLAAEVMSRNTKKMDYRSITAAAGNNSTILHKDRILN